MEESYFRNHPLRELLDRLLELQTHPTLTNPDLEQRLAFARDKVFAVAKVTQTRLVSASSVLTSIHGLNLIQKVVQTIYNEASAFTSNQNPAHLTNAETAADQQLSAYEWVFGWNDRHAPGVKEVAATIDAFRQASKGAIGQLLEQRNKLSAELSGLQGTINSLRGQARELVNEVTTLQSTADAAVAEVNRKYSEWEAARTTQVAEVLKTYEMSAEVAHQTTIVSSSRMMHELESKLEEARKIVQVVGNVGVTGNYQHIANDEGSQANLWRWITMGLFGAGLIVAIATFVKFFTEPFHPDSLATMIIRLMFAIAITIPAIYTARESARHRTTADRARQAELELATLGPFIELLPEDRKHAIREELTKQYFGRTVEAHTAESVFSTKDVLELVDKLTKNLKR